MQELSYKKILPKTKQVFYLICLKVTMSTSCIYDLIPEANREVLKKKEIFLSRITKEYNILLFYSNRIKCLTTMEHEICLCWKISQKVIYVCLGHGCSSQINVGAESEAYKQKSFM